ncbi:hypothetical protein LP419_30995 [Massilia sp. H-1]|nr:hypothetical protein LP419_30995 [Massilia sp. H-1]
MKLFADPSWDVMSPERPLRHWRLVEVAQGGGQQLVASAIRADERIVNYVKGLNYLDEALAPLLTLHHRAARTAAAVAAGAGRRHRDPGAARFRDRQGAADSTAGRGQSGQAAGGPCGRL